MLLRFKKDLRSMVRIGRSVCRSRVRSHTLSSVHFEGVVMRRALVVGIALVLALLTSDGLFAQRSHRSSSSSSKSYHSKSYSAPKSARRSSTYKSNGTRYKYGETYKTTGQPKVERSESAKQQFLRQHGYKKVPPGYEVDHIVPLSKGGADKPSNMQLLPKSTHKQKTASERRRR